MPSHEGKFSAFHDAHTEMSWRGWASMNTYHAPSNRLFAVNSNRSRTYCYDFNTDSYCGNAYNSSPTFGEIQTYGYIGEANCLIGLGDNSIFFSMKPDMSGPCDGSNGYVEVKPCLCSGKVVWPSVLTRNTERLSVFAVRVLDPADNVLLPNDGSEWVDLTGDGVLDLTGLDPTLQHLRVEVTAVASPGPDPWQDPSTVPTLVVGLRDEGPRLSE